MRSGVGKQQRKVANAIFAGLMLALWCLTAALVASPELHHLFHADSQQSSHECLVTQLTKSAPTVSTVHVVAVAAPDSICIYELHNGLPTFSSPDYLVFPSRGPPVVSSPLMVVG